MQLDSVQDYTPSARVRRMSRFRERFKQVLELVNTGAIDALRRSRDELEGHGIPSRLRQGGGY